MIKNLRMLREEAGITQKQLADAIDISQQSINKYENKNIEPDIDTLIRIATYFNTSVDFLVGNSQLRSKVDIVSNYELSVEEVHLLDSFRNLSQKQKECIICVVDSYRQ